MMEEGVNAYWLPKAYDETRLYDKGKERAGIGYFGAMYSARRIVVDYLSRSGTKIKAFKCQDHELNDMLNKYLGCLICNLGVNLLGRIGIGRALFPRAALCKREGPEPMLKNFEVPGAGCAPIADWIEEMAELGFQDGENIIAYRTLDDLVDKVRYYQNAPIKLDLLRQNAYILARTRHTWRKRAEQFRSFLVQQGV